jgi:hypothetical protein
MADLSLTIENCQMLLTWGRGAVIKSKYKELAG